ncbi:MAG: hypothetical protein ABF968_04140 [Acetobacter sp.]|uniref:hypothetical protein n=1 Tax=Acetobacter sp. TaxID=440 RepID=UPI0039ED3514
MYSWVQLYHKNATLSCGRKCSALDVSVQSIDRLKVALFFAMQPAWILQDNTTFSGKFNAQYD